MFSNSSCRSKNRGGHAHNGPLDKDKCTYGCAPVDIPLAIPSDHNTTTSTLTSMGSTGSDRRKQGSRLRDVHCGVGGSAAYSSIWDYPGTGAHDRSTLYSTLPPPSGIYCKKHDVVLNLSDYATARAAVGHAQPYTAARDAYVDDEPDCLQAHLQVGDDVRTDGGQSGGPVALNRDGYFQLQAAVIGNSDSDTNTGVQHANGPSGSVDLLTFNPKTATSQT